LGVTTTSLGINKGASSVDSTNINLWLDGRSKWNCEANTCSSGSCGAWTQIIWKDSIRIGCALSKCTTGSPLSVTTWEYLLCLYNPAGNMVKNGVKQHPFGTETDKCNLPLPALVLSEDPMQITSAAISDETAQHHEVSTHTHTEQSVLSVGALVGIIVGTILGAAVIVVVAIQLRAKTTYSEIPPI
jgi:hypothetical protein